MDIRGLTVHEVWVEGASDIAAEYYASIVFDRCAKPPLVMLSTQGGMDIEEVAEEDPNAIARCTSTRCSASRTSTGAGWPSRPGVDADVVRPIGALPAPPLRRPSSPRRRCSSRSTR